MSKYFSTGADLQAALEALPASKTGSFTAFDPFFYGQTYMTSYAGDLSPIEHFVQVGAARGYKPNATFDPSYYQASYPDLTGLDGADLLYHFMMYGLDEGRVPNSGLASFNGIAYLNNNPDVKQFVQDKLAQFGGSLENGALAHYVKFGAAEGREAIGAVTGNVFTLDEVAPNVIKTFLWKNVDTSALKEMIAYANTVNNRGGNDVTSVTDGNDAAPNDEDGDAYFFDTAHLGLLEDLITEYTYSELVDEQIVWNPARLTPAGATLGVLEAGNTTARDDLIVAGTSYALHGAYIDGGAGYNTLDVEMKGPFAQAKQLLNIQKVQVHNVSNYYDPALFGYNDSGRTGTGSFDITNYLQGVSLANSILDLSNARQLDKLEITESGAAGSLTVLGIRNYVDTKLEGGFDQDVILHYTTGQKEVLNLELVNVDFGSTNNGGALILGHNAGHVAVDSQGFSNILNDVNFGNSFQKLTVTGSGKLAINENLEFAFNTVEIDASANTGGVVFDIEAQGGVGEFEEVTIKGSQARDQIKVQDTAAGVHLDIDLGAGRNTLDLAGVDAGSGSVITGENLTVRIVGDDTDSVAAGNIENPQNNTITATTNLTRADISGVDAFVLDGATALPSLRITQAQFAALGADAFTALHRDQAVELLVNITSNTTLSELVELDQLNPQIKLAFVVSAGATLTLSAAELDKYVAVNGIVMADTTGAAVEGIPASQGKVVITDAGLNFNYADNGDVENGETAYLTGGSILSNWGQVGENITVIRSTTGYDRPAAVDLDDTLTIDTTAADVTVAANVLGADDDFTLQVKKLVLKGANDVNFEAPVSFESGAGVNTNNFSIDASGLTGSMNGLTITDFNAITSGAPNTWGTIKGTAGNDRINVQLSGDVGVDDVTGGLKSTGVETYVVTDLGGANRNFFVCDNTQGYTTLGLQGNVGNEITFQNVKFGTNFLLEGDGQADWNALPKEVGNPNTSNVGTLNAEYFLFDANMAANVTINNRGVDLGVQTDGTTPRAFAVDGINIANVDTINITIENGDAVINEVTGIVAGTTGGADELDNIKITSANDVTVTLLNANSQLESFDASGVAGDMTVVIDAGNVVNLGATDISGVDAVVLEDGAVLTLSIADFNEIGVANITNDTPTNGTPATLNLVGLDETPFSVADFNDGIVLGTLTVAVQADGVVTLDPATDLTGATSITIPAGMTLNLTGEQFQQMNGNGTINGAGTVNITGITQADIDAGLNLSGITAVRGQLTFVGNVGLAAGTNLGAVLLDIDTDADTTDGLPFAPEGSTVSAQYGFSIDLADGQQLTMATVEQAHNRVVNGGANTKVIFGFTSEGAALVDFNDDAPELNGLNLAYYSNVSTVEVLSTLVANENVEQILGNLSENTLVLVNDPEAQPGQADPTFRNIEIAATDTVAGSLTFENLNYQDPDFVKLTDISITLKGNAHITGDILIPGGLVQAQGFETLTIKSEGTAANSIAVGDEIAAPNNNLLDVVINATAALTVGDITFSSEVAAQNTAALAVGGTANVTIAHLDASDADIDVLNVTNNGTGTLTVTGGSPAIMTNDATQTVNLAGSGAMVFGTVTPDSNDGDALPQDIDPGVAATGALVIDADTMTGSLNLGYVTVTNDFTFSSGTGVTVLTIGGEASSNGDDDALSTAEMGANDDWSIDLVDAAAGSSVTIAATSTTLTDGNLSINLGTQGNKTLVLDGDVAFGDLVDSFKVLGTGTLQVNGDVDFRTLTAHDNNNTTPDVSEITWGDLNIVLAAGASVQMTDEQYAAFTAAGGTITGAGTTLVITAAGDYTDFRGVTSVVLDRASLAAGAVELTAAQAQVAFDANVARNAAGAITSITPTLWDSPDADVGVNDARLVGDFRGAGLTVNVQVDADYNQDGVKDAATVVTDISTLQNVNSFNVETVPGDIVPGTATTKAVADLPNLRAYAAQLGEFDEYDAGGATRLIEALGKLTVKVDYQANNDEGTGLVDKVADVTFTPTLDADNNLDTLVVSGLAGAIAQEDGVNAFGDLLNVATAINWIGAGSVYSSQNDPLNANGLAKDAFVFVASSTNVGVTSINNFQPGADAVAPNPVNVGDVLNFTAFLGATTVKVDADVNAGDNFDAYSVGTGEVNLVNASIVSVKGVFADAAAIDALFSAAAVAPALSDTTFLSAASGEKYVVLAGADAGAVSAYYVEHDAADAVNNTKVTLIGTISIAGGDVDNLVAANLV